MIYNSWQVAVKYIKYYITASNGKGHGMHSPFVFDFIMKVLNDRKEYAEYKIVENLRRDLLHNTRQIEVEDFGAGSVISNTKKRSVSSITRHAVKSKKYSQLLFRIARFYNPMEIIEMGTSLGLSASYLALANPKAKITTIEGSPAIARTAGLNFEQMGLRNIELITGDFDHVLPNVLNSKKTVDLVFVDGNHKYESTMNYFVRMIPFMKNDSIMIFDDIHWSAGMEQAWREIGDHEMVKCTIDLFFFGLVFFRSEFRVKQHFRIRF